MEESRFTMRIHPIIMQKMKYIAKHNGRSLNKEIEQILMWIVDDYERKCGKIILTDINNQLKNTINTTSADKSTMNMLFNIEKNNK